MLFDEGNKVAGEFGLAFTMPEDLRPVYSGLGIDVPGTNGDSSYSLPIPATYVIKTDKTVVAAFVDADYTKRLEPDDILAALKSI